MYYVHDYSAVSAPNIWPATIRQLKSDLMASAKHNEHDRGSRNTPSRFMLQKPEISAGLMGHSTRMQTLPFTQKNVLGELGGLVGVLLLFGYV